MSVKISITKEDYRAVLSASGLVDAEAESDEFANEMWGSVIDQLLSLRLKMRTALDKKGEL